MTSIELDLRVSGAWRYVMVANEGFEVAFHGEYREIVPDERIVHTEVFESKPDARALTTVTFREAHGQTKLAILVQYDNRQDRDAHNHYMHDGMQEAMAVLERTAISLASS